MILMYLTYAPVAFKQSMSREGACTSGLSRSSHGSTQEETLMWPLCVLLLLHWEALVHFTQGAKSRVTEEFPGPSETQSCNKAAPSRLAPS